MFQSGSAACTDPICFTTPDAPVNTTIAGNQSQSAVAVAPNGISLLVFRDESPSITDATDAGDIRGRLFDRFGTALGADFIVHTTRARTQQSPDVAAGANGDFLIVWSDGSLAAPDTSLQGIRGRRIRSDGTFVDAADFLINTTTTQDQSHPKVSAGANGSFVVVWRDASRTGADSSVSAIRARRLLANGSFAANDFIVNSTYSGAQIEPDIAVAADGNYLVAWNDADDGSGTGVRARLFDPGDQPVGGDFLVNTTTSLDQTRPVLAVADDGSYLASWIDRSIGVDTSPPGIRGARISNTGVPAADFQINTTLSGTQTTPAVGYAQADRSFVVAWADSSHTGADSNGYAIRARVVDQATGLRGAEVVVNTTTFRDQTAPSVPHNLQLAFPFAFTDGSGGGGDADGSAVRARFFRIDDGIGCPAVPGLCSGHGSCVSGPTEATACACDPGWEGERCERCVLTDAGVCGGGGSLPDAGPSDASAGATYSAGPGLTLSGSTFSLASNGCTTGQVLKWNAAAGDWVCRDDDDTTYAGVAPIEVSGSSISLSGAGCATNQVLKWSGSAFVCRDDVDTDTDTNTTYSAGAGLVLSGTTFSLGGPAAVVTVDASNYSAVTVQANDFVRVEGTIALSADYDRLRRTNAKIFGGSFEGSGVETIRFGDYAVVVGTTFRNVLLDGFRVTFVNCRFLERVEFPHVSELDHALLQNVVTSGATAIGVLSNAQVEGSTLVRVAKLVNSRISASTIGDPGSFSNPGFVSGNRFSDSTVYLGHESRFIGNSCNETRVELTAAYGDGLVVISGNTFQDLRSGSSEAITIDTDGASAYRSVTVSDNIFMIQSSSPQSIRVTGTPTGIYQVLKICGNNFSKGLKAIDYSGSLQTVVCSNLHRATPLGVTSGGSLVVTSDNIAL